MCVKCAVEFRVEKNGIAVVEMFSDPPQPVPRYLVSDARPTDLRVIFVNGEVWTL